MPAIEEVKSSWADEVELEGGALPSSTEVVENGQKIVTEYKYNEDNKKVGSIFYLTIRMAPIATSLGKNCTNVQD